MTSAEPSPPRAPPRAHGARWGWIAAALVAPLLAVALLGWLGVDMGSVHSSTGAWTTAYVHRVLQLGDFAAVANISQNYSTTGNPLYPSLMVLFGSLTEAAPARIGHLLAAGALGLVGVALAGLWSRGRGWAAGLLAAGALCWPPLLATAAWIRPDTLAIALCLACLLLAVDLAQGRGPLRWLLAGATLGLTYLAREYMLAPAGAALGVGWCLDLARRPAGARIGPALGRALLLVAGLSTCAILPLAEGFWPWNGLDSMLSYGGSDQPPRFGLAQLHYLPTLAPLWLAGLGGLITALLRGRGPARGVAAVSLGALAPYGAFLLSNQQSPQYYLFAHLLLVAGLAGWLDLLPWPWPRRGLALVAVGLALGWSLPRAQALIEGRTVDLSPRLHTEAWPAPAAEIEQIVDWSFAAAGPHPLVVVSQHIENIDSLYAVRHDRPVAALYNPDWRRELPDLHRFLGGAPFYVVTVGSAWHDAMVPPGGALLEQRRTENLVAVLSRYEGDEPLPPTRWRDYPCIDWRGACQQLDWLAGGLEGLRRRAQDPGPAFAEGKAPGIMP